MSEPPIALRLFGRPGVERREGLLVLPVERRTMLLCLLAARGDWMARTEAARLLWPDLSRDRSLANLRKTLHQTRRWPFAAGVEVTADMLRWRVTTDLQRFDDARREARLEEAIALRRGPPLDGLEQPSNAPWTDWLDGLRAQHERDWQALTRARLEDLRDEPGRSADFARELLRADDYDEDALVVLLAAQGAQGLHEEQRRTLSAYAQRWRDDLGIELSARVRAQLGSTPAHSAAADGAAALIGRSAALDRVADKLERDTRLLTITGVAGVGKSSLLKVALRRGSAPVAWIPLDDLDDLASVRSRLAAELGVRVADGTDPLSAVVAALAAEPRLLAFDNCEHLPGLGALVSRLLQAHPQQCIVATSRQRLGIAGEQVLRLEGLELPRVHAAPAAIEASAAWRLFARAATEACADFDAHGHAEAIARIVRRLDGLPLAIVLVARWVRYLTPGRIEADLAQSLDLLEGDEDGDERAEHRSLRATFERSWARLGAREQSCLAALSVLPGDASRRAAQEVGVASLPVLAQLADASLLNIDADARVSMHPLLRQFAAEKLAGEARAAAERRHAVFYLQWMQRRRPAILAGDERVLREIGTEIEHCRTAWRWAVAQADAERLPAAATALLHHYRTFDSAVEGAMLLSEAEPMLERLGPAAAAVVCTAIAQIECRPGRLDGVGALARRAIALAREAGRRDLLGPALLALGNDYLRQGLWLPARRALLQAERHARACHDETCLLTAMQTRVPTEGAVGDNDRAVRLLGDIVRLRLQRGQTVAAAMALNNLTYLQCKQGRFAQAAASAREGLALCPSDGGAVPAITQPYLLFNLALALCGLGEWGEAERRCIESMDLARRRGASEMEAAAAALRVRVALGSGDTGRARTLLRDALPLAASGPHRAVQLDLVLSHLRLQARHAPPGLTGAWAHWFLAQDAVAPPDRAEVEALLDGLEPRDRATALAAAPVRMSLDDAIAEIESALAATPA